MKYVIWTLVILWTLLIATNIPAQQVSVTTNLSVGKLTVTENDGLVVSSQTLDAPSVIPVKVRYFGSWGDLLQFAEDKLGGKRIYNEKGEVVGVGGTYTRLGKILFKDQDHLFDEPDFIAAYLGGKSGKVGVGNRTIQLRDIESDKGIFLMSKDDSCIDDHCITGKSWLKHYFVYHSVGSKTTQTAGGTGTATYQCCSTGQLVTKDGTRKCRRLNPDSWEYDQETGQLLPTFDEGELYIYTPPGTCRRQVLSNSLTVSATLVLGPNSRTFLGPLTVTNQREVEIGRWQIPVLGGGGTELDEPVNVREVVGVCGFHNSSSSGSIQTTNGFTGDDDVLCLR